jgi:hypothetical protein
MSLGETQAIFYELERIVALLERAETGSKKIKEDLPQVTAVVMSVQQALRVFWRLTSLFRKLGLPERWEETIRGVNTLARAATYAYFSVNLLMLGTPYGYIAGGIGLFNMATVTVAMSPMEGY